MPESSPPFLAFFCYPSKFLKYQAFAQHFLILTQKHTLDAACVTMPILNTTNANRDIVIFDDAGRTTMVFGIASLAYRKKSLRQGIEIRLLPEDLIDYAEEDKNNSKRKSRKGHRSARQNNNSVSQDEYEEKIEDEFKKESEDEDAEDSEDEDVEDSEDEDEEESEEEKNSDEEYVERKPGRKKQERTRRVPTAMKATLLPEATQAKLTEDEMRQAKYREGQEKKLRETGLGRTEVDRLNDGARIKRSENGRDDKNTRGDESMEDSDEAETSVEEDVKHKPGRRGRRAERASRLSEEEMETLEDHQQKNDVKHEDVDMEDMPGEEESRSNMELPFRPGPAF